MAWARKAAAGTAGARSGRGSGESLLGGMSAGRTIEEGRLDSAAGKLAALGRCELDGFGQLPLTILSHKAKAHERGRCLLRSSGGGRGW